jgi:hypothetical protein
MKILIGTPIIKTKEYSWQEYVQAIKTLELDNEQYCNVLCVETTSEGKMLKTAVRDQGFLYLWAGEDKKPMDKVVTARNRIIDYAITEHYDYILFVDSDVIIPRDAIKRLLANLKPMSIIGGFYPTLNEYELPTATAKLIKNGKIIDFPDDDLDGIKPVQIIGMGCTLIPSDVFKNIQFRCERGKNNEVTKSEDWSYCEDLLLQGYEILFDTECIAKHKIVGCHWQVDTA